MDIKTFAETYHLKVHGLSRSPRPGCQPDRPYVPGKRGWITEAQGGLLKAFVTGRRIGHILEQARRLGIANQGRGDSELMLWFDPDDRQQARLTLRTIKARKRRTVPVTPELRDRLARMREARRIPVLV